MSDRYNDSKVLKSEKGREYYESIHYPVVERKDTDIYIITRRGDRMDLLSNKYYGDSRYWWIIALANEDVVTFGTTVLPASVQIRIPVNKDSVISMIKEVNNI